MSSQTYIPGTEPPDEQPPDPEIDAAIERWYARRAEQKLAAEATSVTHAKLLELVAESGGTRYQFTEPGTGKRRYLVLDNKRRLRSERAKPAKQEAADLEWARQIQPRGEAAASPAVSNGKRHPRAAEPEPPDDPFAATRVRLTGSIARGARKEREPEVREKRARR